MDSGEDLQTAYDVTVYGNVYDTDVYIMMFMRK